MPSLSRLLLVTSGNLTGIVDRLEEQRLVGRNPDKRDRRVVRVRLTPKGRRLTTQLLRRHAEGIQNALAFMPREALLQLGGLLGQMRDGLRDTMLRRDNARQAGRQQQTPPSPPEGEQPPVSSSILSS